MSHYKYLSAAFLLVFSMNAHTATKQTEIEFNFKHTPFVKFIGTAPGSNRMYDNNDIANWIYPRMVELGTLGLASNILGDCDINFSTGNNFDLLHTVSGNSLTQYKIYFQSEVFASVVNPTLTIPCNTLPTSIQFKPSGIVFGNIWESVLIQSGIYRDVVNVVVTTQ